MNALRFRLEMLRNPIRYWKSLLAHNMPILHRLKKLHMVRVCESVHPNNYKPNRLSFATNQMTT